MTRNIESLLEMPLNYVKVDEEAMEYIEGGQDINIANSYTYMSRSKCLAKAKQLKKNNQYCINMSALEVAKEIHAHAVIVYMGVPAVIAAVATGHPIVATGIYDLAKHGLNGIDLGDNHDSKERVAAYNAVWPLGVA